MNFISSSPILILLYAWAILYILMGVHFHSLSKIQKRLFPLLGLLLCILNYLLRQQLGPAAYGKLILLTMHLPTFLVFRYITKTSIIKTAFMILTALVFTAPVILLGNLVRQIFFVGSSKALLLANLVSFGIMLLLAYFVFRQGFQYLLKYGDNRFFLLFSIVPLLYYLYVLAIVNFDFSALHSLRGYIVRFIPTLEVFAMYFLLPQIYRSLSE